MADSKLAARTRRPPEPPAPEESRPAETRSSAPEKAAAASCNVPGCDETPEWRGLCSAHRQTHRGLADPKERSGD